MNANAINTMRRDEYPGRDAGDSNNTATVQTRDGRVQDCRLSQCTHQASLYGIVYRPERKDVDIVKEVLLMREGM